jgi:hypothetical protein
MVFVSTVSLTPVTSTFATTIMDSAPSLSTS